MRPNPVVAREAAYAVSRHGAPIDLKLDGNEGAPPPAALLATLADPELCRRYPDGRAVERLLAERLAVAPERVLVCCGADDALDRACRAFLWPGRELIIPVPTFEMLPRYAALAGGTMREVAWPAGAYPVDEVLAAVGPDTAAVALVSPNNPTGAAITARDLERVAAGAPDAALFVDLAYAEYADEDLTAAALAHPHAIVFRTLSKAWGLAGLRVGYAIAAPQVVAWMRATGHPYAVASTSLALAAAWLGQGEAPMRRAVAQVKTERARLCDQLNARGAEALPSQANFVLCRPRDAVWLRDGLAGLGVAVRIWPKHPKLDGLLRITCPADETAFARLGAAVDAVLAPEALLFDMDGVLADVTLSYRAAIAATAAHFGADVGPGDIARAKANGDANNDWKLTHALVAERGGAATFEQVKARFEELYQGTPGTPGLCERETLLCERALLERLARRVKLGVVTGRPRADAERFLRAHALDGLFGALVCMEDAPLKPRPEPVFLALERLGSRAAWLVGDTPDDARAARAAGVVPVGYFGGAGAALGLSEAGAARVLGSLDELETLLP